MADTAEISEQEYREKLKAIFKDRGIPMEPVFDLGGGIRIDFCYGLRLLFPQSLETRKYRLEIYDLDHGLKMIDETMESGEYYVAKRKYFVRYGVRVTPLFEKKICYHHEFNAKDMPVVVDIPVETLGDSIAWFSCLDKFRQKHGCELYVRIVDYVRKLFEKRYPEIHFVSKEQKDDLKPYASYMLGIFSDDLDSENAPVDYRTVGLHHYASYLLGMKPEDAETPPKIEISSDHRPCKEPYVCISSYGSGMCKNWINRDGWREVIQFLNSAGYRVLDIDAQNLHGSGIIWNEIPRNAEDYTGNKPLSQRASLISKADFFIGLPSGLSWLAWCCKVPVVLISGFSMPYNEFYTPYRVINMNVCHGCYADQREKFVPSEFDWCPRHKGTARHYECSRGITASMVIESIKRIPAFQKRIKVKEK